MRSRPFRYLALATIAVCLVALLGPRLVHADRNHITLEFDGAYLGAEDHHADDHDAADAHDATDEHRDAYDAELNEHSGEIKTASQVSVGQGDVLYEQSFPMRAGDRLVITLSSEDVIVERGSGSGTTVTVEGHGRDAREEFERRRFSAAFDGGELRIRTDPERRRNHGNVRAGFNVIVRAPERMDVEIHVASGDVQLDQLVGPLSVKAASGDIELGAVQGPRIDIETASGDISAESLDGPVSLSAASGDITVGRIVGIEVDLSTASGDIAVATIETDHLDASAASGDIEVDHLRGRADLSTASGDVSVHLADAADISTGSGSVTLYLARGAGFDVDLQSSDIDIADALSFSGSTNRRHMDGRLGNGGPRLDISTGSGSITLRSN